MRLTDLPQLFPSNTFVGKLLRFPLRLVGGNRARRILSGPGRGLRLLPRYCMHGYWLGTYERDGTLVFAEAIRPGMTVWDVGANIGYYAIIARRRAGSGGRVVAVEPMLENVTAIRAHLKINQFDDVVVVEAAAARGEGTAHFHVPSSVSDGYLDEHGEREVRTIALDSLLNYGPPDVLKIDVEGFADHVFAGASQVLDSRPLILLATHPRTGEPERCRALLEARGYSVHPFGFDPDLWECRHASQSSSESRS